MIAVTLEKTIRIPDPIKLARYQRNPDPGPRILFFSGGRDRMLPHGQFLLQAHHRSARKMGRPDALLDFVFVDSRNGKYGGIPDESTLDGMGTRASTFRWSQRKAPSINEQLLLPALLSWT